MCEPAWPRCSSMAAPDNGLTTDDGRGTADALPRRWRCSSSCDRSQGEGDIPGDTRHASPPRSATAAAVARPGRRSEEHTSELQSRENLVCRLLLEKKK